MHRITRGIRTAGLAAVALLGLMVLAGCQSYEIEVRLDPDGGGHRSTLLTGDPGGPDEEAAAATQPPPRPTWDENPQRHGIETLAARLAQRGARVPAAPWATLGTRRPVGEGVDLPPLPPGFTGISPDLASNKNK